MKSRIKAFTALACAALLLACVTGPFTLVAFAADGEDGVVYENADSGFKAYILDDIDLLTPQEEADLLEEMKPITEFGHIIFWSTEEPTDGREIKQAQLKRRELTLFDSAGILAINMNARKITFQSYGRIYSIVSKSLARSITDNVSRYATRGDYYACAANAYQQVYTLMDGNRISEPMRYMSSACIALMLGLLIASLVVFGKKQNTVYKEIVLPLSAVTVASMVLQKDISSDLVRTIRKYSPQSSGSGCSGGGGGGGGGGSSCGGGGSSSF